MTKYLLGMLGVALLVAAMWLVLLKATSDERFCHRVVSPEAKQLTQCK